MVTIKINVYENCTMLDSLTALFQSLLKDYRRVCDKNPNFSVKKLILQMSELTFDF